MNKCGNKLRHGKNVTQLLQNLHRNNKIKCKVPVTCDDATSNDGEK